MRLPCGARNLGRVGAGDWRGAPALYTAHQPSHGRERLSLTRALRFVSARSFAFGRPVRYVMLNPMRAHLATRAIDYRWSSAAFHAGAVASDPLVETNDLLGVLPDERNWRQLMDTENSESGEKWLRQITRTGRPCGEPAFVAHAERIAGRALAPKKPGPVGRRTTDGSS